MVQLRVAVVKPDGPEKVTAPAAEMVSVPLTVNRLSRVMVPGFAIVRLATVQVVAKVKVPEVNASVNVFGQLKPFEIKVEVLFTVSPPVPETLIPEPRVTFPETVIPLVIVIV